MSLYELGRDYGLVIVSLLASGWAVLKSMARKEFATTEDVRAIATAIHDTKEDLQRQIDEERHRGELLKKDVEKLPTFSQVNELKEKVSEVREAQAGFDATLDGIKGTVDRIDEFLRNQT